MWNKKTVKSNSQNSEIFVCSIISEDSPKGQRSINKKNNVKQKRSMFYKVFTVFVRYKGREGSDF